MSAAIARRDLRGGENGPEYIPGMCCFICTGSNTRPGVNGSASVCISSHSDGLNVERHQLTGGVVHFGMRLTPSSSSASKFKRPKKSVGYRFRKAWMRTTRCSIASCRGQQRSMKRI